MKAQLLVLSDARALELTRVKRLNKEPSIGTIFALDGAWDRKKICLGIGRDERGSFYLLQNLGRIFSDGRWVKPVKATKPVKQYFCYDEPPRWYRRPGYVAVAPTGKSARKLRVLTNLDYEGKDYQERKARFAREHRDWLKSRAQ